MNAIPSFASFELRLRDEHRAAAAEERRKLGEDAPPMPTPRYQHGHGAAIKPPSGATKLVSTQLPAADFIAFAEFAQADGLPLSVYLRKIVQESNAARQPLAATM